jgi:competence protein ComEA
LLGKHTFEGAPVAALARTGAGQLGDGARVHICLGDAGTEVAKRALVRRQHARARVAPAYEEEVSMNPSRIELVTHARRRAFAGARRQTGAASPALRAPMPLVSLRARSNVWAPLLLRALALAVALLGLAGIGSVAGRAQRPAAVMASRAGLELASLSIQALAGSVVTGAADAATPAPTLAPERVAPERAAPGSAASGELARTTAVPNAPEPAAPGASLAGPDLPCPTLSDAAADPAGNRGTGTPEAPVVLNRADANELQRLPGVGTKRAAAILALRQRLGRFRRTSDLLRVKGIGPRTLQRMLPHLVLD